MNASDAWSVTHERGRRGWRVSAPHANGAGMDDTLELEVHDLEVPVLTGIYSEETLLPQPLRISLTVLLDAPRAR